MSLSAPWDDSLDIIALNPVLKIEINQISLSDPWADSIGIIDFQPVRKSPGINPMGLSVPCSDSIDMIPLLTAKKIDRD